MRGSGMTEDLSGDGFFTPSRFSYLRTCVRGIKISLLIIDLH